MPSPPEVSNTLRDIRFVEVLVKAEAEHETETNSHIRIPAEVKIDLKSKRNNPKPGG